LSNVLVLPFPVYLPTIISSELQEVFLNTQIDIHKATYKHFAIIILTGGPYHQNEQGFFSYLSLVKAPYLEKELELIARNSVTTTEYSIALW
jgi:hypothetical protein